MQKEDFILPNLSATVNTSSCYLYLKETKEKGLHDQKLRLGTLPTEKAVAMHWDIKEDKLGFCINFKEKPSTKRGMLSMVSSIYDPLGLVSPFLLEGRCIIQMLCHNHSAWDDPVDEGIQEKWAKWKCNLNILKDIRLSRCYKPEGFGQVISSIVCMTFLMPQKMDMDKLYM